MSSVTAQLAAPRPLQRRRLKRRFLVSTVLLGFVLAMYVLEGLAIAAAQSYAHVRVLSKVSGKGGLGVGKEDERWLIPWVIYVFLQGGLVVGCIWMVWGIKREMKLSNQKWTHGKGKGIRKSTATAERKNEPQATKAERETDMFLPKAGVLSAQARQERENTEDNEEEGVDVPQSRITGYHPIFSSFEPLAVSDLPRTNPTSASSQPFNFTLRALNPHGEGSSRGSYHSLGSNKSFPIPNPSLPIARLPEKVGSWWTERSHAETKLQQPDSNLDRWGWVSENKGQNREEQELRGQTNGEERRNSWAQDEVEELERVGGKDKGKGRQKDGDLDAGIELKTYVPRELFTGVNLDKQYHFTDGLAYPLLPISPRRPKNATDDKNRGTNNDGLASPFSLPLPPQRPLPATPKRNGRLAISPTTNALSRFPKTPTSTSSSPHSSSNFTFSSPSSSSRLPPYRPISSPSTAYSSVCSPSPIHRPQYPSTPYTPPPVHHHPSPYLSPITPSSSSRYPYPFPNSSSPSPPPLASPLSSPFPVFPFPPPRGPPRRSAHKLQEQPVLRIPSRAPLARRFSVGKGKRRSYRRIESALGTVSEGMGD
ncbi:MAG: hypothetical protein LQ343_007888 [Gyalolechia ehrenbergii]|nr:MAG: hypothetical protein LQ343_007888 [Gyalolechia ehrenbergii]